MPRLSLFVCDICKTEQRLEFLNDDLLPPGWAEVGVTVKKMLPASRWPVVCSAKCAARVLIDAAHALVEPLPPPSPTIYSEPFVDKTPSGG